MKKNILFIVIIATLFCACRKPIIYPDEPVILNPILDKCNFVINEDTIKGAMLIFEFQDGDGDIGLNEEDDYPPFDLSSIYYYNLFIDYYEKQNGEFVKVDWELNNIGDTVPFSLNARIPRLSKQLKEPIDGEITHYILRHYPFSSISDTMKLKFYIVDRKRNESNVLEAKMIR